ncbi:MAG: hypothetical protein SF172_14215 [Burkholderiales bacterium]|nr:hypothetical protein [Burkholderiales bacterium]
MPAATLANIRGVLFDIDDTLTSDGRLSAAACANKRGQSGYS